MKINFLRSINKSTELLEPLKLPSIGMVGRSNVGKSSFINCLNNKIEVAKTSSKPGHTKLLNLYQLEKQCHLIDFPGYGYAKADKTSRQNLIQLIFHGLSLENLNLKFVFQLIDAKIGAQPIDLELNNFLQTNEIDYEVILNKSEKLKNSEKAQLLKDCKIYFPGKTPIFFSTLTGIGKAEVNQLIHQKINIPKGKTK